MLVFCMRGGPIFAPALHLGYITVVFLPAATKLHQGNIFTCVCYSVHRGDLCHCMLGYTTPPRADPPGSRHPPLRTGTPLQEQVPSSGAGTPTPTPLGPGAATPLGYSQ